MEDKKEEVNPVEDNKKEDNSLELVKEEKVDFLQESNNEQYLNESEIQDLADSARKYNESIANTLGVDPMKASNPMEGYIVMARAMISKLPPHSAFKIINIILAIIFILGSGITFIINTLVHNHSVLMFTIELYAIVFIIGNILRIQHNKNKTKK